MSQTTPPAFSRVLILFALGAGLPNLLTLAEQRPVNIAFICALFWGAAAGKKVSRAADARAQMKDKILSALFALIACLGLSSAVPMLFDSPTMNWTLTVTEHHFAWLVVGVVLAPIAEERFFRGALFAALFRKHRPFVAIVGTALAFAVAHPVGVHMTIALCVGLVLGILRHSSGDWRLCAVVHAAINAAVWLLS